MESNHGRGAYECNRARKLNALISGYVSSFAFEVEELCAFQCSCPFLNFMSVLDAFSTKKAQLQHSGLGRQ